MHRQRLRGVAPERRLRPHEDAHEGTAGLQELRGHELPDRGHLAMYATSFGWRFGYLCMIYCYSIHVYLLYSIYIYILCLYDTWEREGGDDGRWKAGCTPISHEEDGRALPKACKNRLKFWSHGTYLGSVMSSAWKREMMNSRSLGVRCSTSQPSS